MAIASAAPSSLRCPMSGSVPAQITVGFALAASVLVYGVATRAPSTGNARA